MPKTHKILKDRNDLFVTGSVSCDDKITREKYRKLTNTIVSTFDHVKTMFDTNKDLTLCVRNIRGNTLGFYNNGKSEIAIDIRNLNEKSIVSTMIHEFTHANQYKTKKLSNSKVKDKVVWNKVEMTKYDSKKDHQKYLDQPWEIEARENEKKYTNEVCKVLGIK